VSEKVKLTPKEQDHINRLQELAKTWPRSLLIGCDTDSPYCEIFKKGKPDDNFSAIGVGKVKIRNLDDQENW
jgi:hypothetical protein